MKHMIMHVIIYQTMYSRVNVVDSFRETAINLLTAHTFSFTQKNGQEKQMGALWAKGTDLYSEEKAIYVLFAQKWIKCTRLPKEMLK